MALRAALGAGRVRLIRQMVTESVLLSLAGGALGIAFARLGMSLLAALVPTSMSVSTLDARVLLFLAAIALGTGVLFGLAPALEASKLDLNEALKQGLRTGSSKGTGRLRDVFVVAEVALALVLLVGAGLMVRTLYRLQSVDLGFRAEKRDDADCAAAVPETKRAERVQFTRRCWGRCGRTAGRGALLA